MKIKSLLGIGLIWCLTGIMSGCGHHSDNAPAPAADGPSGTVLQGPVKGATVVAKKAGNNDFSKVEKYDGVHDEFSVKTDVTGKFKFQSDPPYAHTLVMLTDGIDTLTGQKNIQMIAKAGSAYITPLTTLVATDTTGTVEAKLVALAGMPPGSSIGNVDTSNTIPAALIVSKSVEIAVAAISSTVTQSAGTNNTTDAQKAAAATQLAAVQTQTLLAIAVEIAKPATTTATLSVPSSLTTTLSNAITNPTTGAIATITAANSNITVATANVATIAASVSTNSVGSSVLAVSAPAGATTAAQAAATTTPAAVTGVIAESDKININAATGSAAATAATTITSDTSTAVTATSTVTTVIATPPTYVPPVVKTALAPSIISATLNIPASGLATITVTFNHAVNNDGIVSVKVGTTDFPGTTALNSAADTITFTAASTPTAGSTLTVTVSGNTASLSASEAVENFSAAMSATTIIIAVPVIPTGSTGTSTGTF